MSGLVQQEVPTFAGVGRVNMGKSTPIRALEPEVFEALEEAGRDS